MKIINYIYIFILFILFGIFLNYSSSLKKVEQVKKPIYGYDIEFPLLPNGEPDEEKIKEYRKMIK